jgi:hypothetical protein
MTCSTPDCRAVDEGDPAHCSLCRTRAIVAERDALRVALARIFAADDAWDVPDYQSEGGYVIALSAHYGRVSDAIDAARELLGAK